MRLADWIIARLQKRSPDLQIGGSENPYMNRWYVIPRNRVFNIYLHQFIRDDEDRALHDHPWWSVSLCLLGRLFEVTTDNPNGPWNVIYRGAWTWRSAMFAHRLIVPMSQRGNTWTLFITGPRLREWGFHCPNGWVHWRDFTSGEQGEIVGRGCGEMT